jgi:hypothetical protein
MILLLYSLVFGHKGVGDIVAKTQEKSFGWSGGERWRIDMGIRVVSSPSREAYSASERIGEDQTAGGRGNLRISSGIY